MLMPSKRCNTLLMIHCGREIPVYTLDSALIREQLAHAGVRACLRCYAEIDSTNREMWRTLEATATADPPPPNRIARIAVADRQSAGYGRIGRDWHSPSGVNLYLTVYFCADDTVPVPSLLIAAAVSTRQVICDLGRQQTEQLGPELIHKMEQPRPELALKMEEASPEPLLKWPNDIVFGQKKVSGLLLETRRRAGGLTDVVLGAGINVNMTDADVPDGVIGQPWTSLKLVYDIDFDLTEVAQKLICAWQHSLLDVSERGLAPFLRRWDEYDSLRGQDITVSLVSPNGQGGTSGRYAGLDSAGRLRLKTGTKVHLFDSALVSLSDDSQKGF